MASATTLRQQLRATLASAYARFVELKTEHQYLGRYSVEKFDLFNQYQQTASLPRVLAVIALSPLPTIVAVLAVDRIPLNDPLLGAKHNLMAFARSAFSHTIVTYSALIIFKQALALSARDYSHAKMILISVCTSVASESLWVTLAFTWRFPVPCREIMGLFSWSACTILFNVLLARDVVRRYTSKIIKYMPTAGIQLTLFYAFLALSLAFALIPTPAQVVMIIAFPLLKMFIKHQLWKLARQVDDLSTDVTVCMVEISSSLYQTVCLQLVNSITLEVLIMIMDLVQAAIEVHTYVDQDYISDGRTTMQTTTNIIRSAVFPGAIERVAVGPKRRDASKAEQGRRPSILSLSGLHLSFRQSLSRDLLLQQPQQQGTAITTRSPHHRHHHQQQKALIFGTPEQHFVGSKLIRRLQSKRRKGAYVAATSQRELYGDGDATMDADVATQQFYVHRKRVSKRGIRRLLDLKQIAPATTDELGHATDLFAKKAASKAVMLDGITIQRREQARILEQTLQLLFSCEVLLFVEYMEVAMPLLYMSLLGGVWDSPNSKYNMFVMALAQTPIRSSVVNAVVYALLESFSFVFMCWFMKRKYGVSALYQLAFVLENYWMTLHGKLAVSFVTILNSATVHHGVDFSLQFDFAKLMRESASPP